MQFLFSNFAGIFLETDGENFPQRGNMGAVRRQQRGASAHGGKKSKDDGAQLCGKCPYFIGVAPNAGDGGTSAPRSRTYGRTFRTCGGDLIWHRHTESATSPGTYSPGTEDPAHRRPGGKSAKYEKSYPATHSAGDAPLPTNGGGGAAGFGQCGCGYSFYQDDFLYCNGRS